MVLPGATLAAAVQRAEDLRQKCSEIRIEHGEKIFQITLSFGIAAFPEHGSEAESIVIHADQAMYHSKKTGRNRVSTWNEVI